MYSSPALFDPTVPPEYQSKDPPFGNQRGNASPGSRIALSPRLVPGQTTRIFVCAGQSLMSNFTNNPYTASTDNAQNLNIYDGAIYRCADPILGADNGGGSIVGRIADKLIAAGVCQRAIMVPVAIGGTSASEWDPANSRLWGRVLSAFVRLKSLGLVADGYLWEQGQFDAASGISQAAHAAIIGRILGGVATISPSTKCFVARSTYPANDTGGQTATAIRAAQASVVNNTTIFAGPDTDTLGASYRWDGTHLGQNGATNGADAHAALWSNAIDAVF